MEKTWTLEEVAAYFHAGKSTVKRWLLQARRGQSDFPMPIAPKGYRLLWRKEDIELWSSRIGNVPPEQPDTMRTETPAERQRRNDEVARGLEKLGITLTRKGD